jgi:hypothetical protein
VQEVQYRKRLRLIADDVSSRSTFAFNVRAQRYQHSRTNLLYCTTWTTDEELRPCKQTCNEVKISEQMVGIRTSSSLVIDMNEEI